MSFVENKTIWVSIDERTEANGRYVTDVIPGVLEIDNLGKMFYINSKVLEKINCSMIAKVFDKSLSMLWSQGIIHGNVRSLISKIQFRT